MKTIPRNKKPLKHLILISLFSGSVYADVHNGPAAPSNDDLSYQVYNQLLEECIHAGGTTTECVKNTNNVFASETERQRQNQE
ncbi:hypothetical protein JCM19231_303 [Vibrio ishigakensis]|uniref:Uncharacterized protein n=1 Tax=Vibrio ishigakensis TaxID=1481914 RepID=A0A0B8NRD8_9VIBR|nr:hypothetical protein [Vibrio ishigakensis]GAM56476.1 hypothetical protein JCM19231_303 [Vibrio ishigakensis]